MPGKKYDSIQNPSQYRALKREGYSKRSAAKISNAAEPPGKSKKKGSPGRARTNPGKRRK